MRSNRFDPVGVRLERLPLRALAVVTVVVFSACASEDGDAQTAVSRPAETAMATTIASSTVTATTAPSAIQPAPETSSADVAEPLGAPPSGTATPDFSEVPAVDGFSYGPPQQPDVPVPWSQLDLPDSAAAFTFALRENGAPIGTLIVADGFSHSTYLDHLFESPIDLVRSFSDSGSETVQTLGQWRALSAIPVVAATSADAFFNQWVWQHDGTTWIATGTMNVERWVTGVIAAQQLSNPTDRWDYSLLGGTLYDGLPIVQPYIYVDEPVADFLTGQEATFLSCARRLYGGRVVPVDDPDAVNPDATDLRLTALTVGGACLANGWLDDLEATLANAGFQPATIGDVPVLRTETTVIMVDEDNVYELSSTAPLTLIAMEPFITAFVTRDLPPDVTDDTTLPVGTCLYRAAPPMNGDDASRRTYSVGCGEPHHGEVFHRFEVTVPPGDPYPGDAETSRRADEGCSAGFGAYVGLPFPDSRLQYLYFYPSSETWTNGDRGVMCILHGESEELFRMSHAGSKQ